MVFGSRRLLASLTLSGGGLFWATTKAARAEKASIFSGQIDLLKKLNDMMDRFVARQRHFHDQSRTLTLTDEQSLPWIVGLASLLKAEMATRREDMQRDDDSSPNLGERGFGAFDDAPKKALELLPFLPVADACYEASEDEFLKFLRKSSASSSSNSNSLRSIAANCDANSSARASPTAFSCFAFFMDKNLILCPSVRLHS